MSSFLEGNVKRLKEVPCKTPSFPLVQHETTNLRLLQMPQALYWCLPRRSVVCPLAYVSCNSRCATKGWGILPTKTRQTRPQTIAWNHCEAGCTSPIQVAGANIQSPSPTVWVISVCVCVCFGQTSSLFQAPKNPQVGKVQKILSGAHQLVFTQLWLKDGAVGISELDGRLHQCLKEISVYKSGRTASVCESISFQPFTDRSRSPPFQCRWTTSLPSQANHLLCEKFGIHEPLENYINISGLWHK